MKLIIANWKMNPALVAEAIELAKATDYENLVICPPFPFLESVGEVIRRAKLGAQDLSCKNPTGPFTGEVSAAELKSLGAAYVIIGHSERRQSGETNELVAKKFLAAWTEGLIPILCVGETLEQKNAGQKEKVILEQITTAFQSLSSHSTIQQPSSHPIYVAVEPVWAISANPKAEVDTPENTLETIDFIRQELVKLKVESVNVKFLYGGSVNSTNIESFIKHDKIEGALVGGASLKTEEVKKMASIAKIYS